MPSFAEGASLGAQIVNRGFDQYWQQRDYSDRLAQRAEERAYRTSQAKNAQDYRMGELGVQMARAKDTADYRTSELGMRKSHYDAEKAHWDKLEALAGQHGGRGAGGPLSPAQATSALGEIDRIYSRKDAPAMDKDTWNRREQLKSIQLPGYTPKPFTEEEPHPWLKKLSAMGGDFYNGMTGSGSVPTNPDDVLNNY
jgi:hypothetical protein